MMKIFFSRNGKRRSYVFSAITQKNIEECAKIISDGYVVEDRLNYKPIERELISKLQININEHAGIPQTTVDEIKNKLGEIETKIKTIEYTKGMHHKTAVKYIESLGTIDEIVKASQGDERESIVNACAKRIDELEN